MAEDAARTANWKRCWPYLAERQWSTVREDYSPDGTCWDYFPHDHARSRAYRWGEDGLLGITDRHGYDRKSFRMGIVRLANILRFKYLAMAFGDQGIFVRRETLEEVGGFPRIPLMEDVEISLRLNRFPRVALKETLTVSARRWQLKSFGAYLYQVFTYVLWYLLARRLGGNIDRLTARLHHKYYA